MKENEVTTKIAVDENGGDVEGRRVRGWGRKVTFECVLRYERDALTQKGRQQKLPFLVCFV